MAGAETQTTDEGAQPARGPIFIVGAMGSGTTLLRLMLDSHERIAVPPETGFMRGYDALRFTPFKFSGGNWTKRLGWSRDELDGLARELYERIFMRYASEHGKVRWGDKTPLHVWHIDDMARVFDDAQFVAVVRHPLASIASNMSRFGATQKWGWYHWRRYTAELTRQAARHQGRLVFVRYEDLVLEPAATMRQLLDWLGEPWSDSVLRHHEVQAARKRREHDDSAPWNVREAAGRIRPDDPLDVSRIDKWTRSLTREQREAAGRRVDRLGELYGYAMDAPAPRAPLAADGSHVAPAADVAARIKDFPDVDLDEYARRALQDTLYNPRKVAIITAEEFEEYERLRAPRGLRRLGIALVRALPTSRARHAAIALVRRLKRT